MMAMVMTALMLLSKMLSLTILRNELRTGQKSHEKGEMQNSALEGKEDGQNKTQGKVRRNSNLEVRRRVLEELKEQKAKSQNDLERVDGWPRKTDSLVYFHFFPFIFFFRCIVRPNFISLERVTHVCVRNTPVHLLLRIPMTEYLELTASLILFNCQCFSLFLIVKNQGQRIVL